MSFHHFFLILGFGGLMALSVAGLYFANSIVQIPKFIELIGEFSENIKYLKTMKVQGKSAELLQLLSKLQETSSNYQVGFTRRGDLYCPPNKKLNIIIEILALEGITDSKDISDINIEFFETILYKIPSTFLRNLPPGKSDKPFLISVTPEGFNYVYQSK